MGVLQLGADDLGAGQGPAQGAQIVGDRRPGRGGAAQAEGDLVVGVEVARPLALLVEGLLGHDHDQVAAGLDQVPPAGQGLGGIVHVLQAVAGMDGVVSPRRPEAGDVVGVAVRQVERLGAGTDQIVAAADVDHPSDQVARGEVGRSDGVGLGDFLHGAPPGARTSFARAAET